MEVTLSFSSPFSDRPFGAHLSQAPQNWQLLSADEHGFAGLSLAGTWARPTSAGLLGRNGCEVEIRICCESTGLAPRPDLNWQAAETFADGTWKGRLEKIPSGGPYRLETRLNPKGNKTKEWAWRGDQRHFLAVGDAWILAGQSNVSGYGAPPYDDDPVLGLHLFGQDGRWRMASHPLHDGSECGFPPSMQPYAPGHSPFLQFGKVLQRRLARPIAFLPAALGGSTLSEWEEGGRLAENLFDMLGKAGVTPAGMVFGQGESDAKGKSAATYGERFAQAVGHWRKRIGSATLPIVTYQLSRYYSKNPGDDDEAWSVIREAQRSAAKKLSRVSVVPTLDLPLGDTIHFSSAANRLLGRRMAESALGMGQGADNESPPDLISAHRISPNKVELSFQSVQDRLDSAEPHAQPFRIWDIQGEVTIQRILYPMDNRIEILLSRPLDAEARVSAGFGENPPTLPWDVDRRLPILAFHHQPIT